MRKRWKHSGISRNSTGAIELTDSKLERPKVWIVSGLTYAEIAAQPYEDIIISAGKVEGHPVDTLYFRFERDGEPDKEVFVLVRPDEAAALIQVLSGALWSKLVADD